MTQFARPNERRLLGARGSILSNKFDSSPNKSELELKRVIFKLTVFEKTVFEKMVQFFYLLLKKSFIFGFLKKNVVKKKRETGFLVDPPPWG